MAIPHLGSIILTHTWDGVIKGLKSWPRDQRPPVPVVFFAFRIMVGLGILMIVAGVAGLLLRPGGRIYEAGWLHWFMVAMGPSGFVALLAGWTVTEVGRQPYTVYGMLRTVDSASPIAAPGVAVSLVAFAVVYLIVYASGITFLLKMMSRPPVPGEPGPPKVPVRTAGITPGPAGATSQQPAAAE